MPADRLTAETAKVGMRVVCVDGLPSGPIVEGDAYIIEDIEDITGGRIYLEGPAMGPWRVGRFVIESRRTLTPREFQEMHNAG